MLNSLTIGKKHFDTNLIQAPLAGISCAPFRELIWEFGGVAYCCTEMLSAHHIASGTDRSPRYQLRAANEKNLCWQLSGNNPTMLARASAYAISQGADILDLNCGCPQPKIRKKGCGSKLLSDEKTLSTLVKAMRQDDKTPVTVKMRVDANHNEYSDQAVAQAVEAAGADAIIVHGRHWTHDYDVPSSTDAIASVVSAVSIPVIANGDITGAAQLEKVFAQTQCAGFMVGRAGVGQPWLFAQLAHAMKGEPFSMPSQAQIGRLFLQHVQGLITVEGEQQAIFQSRRLGKYYARFLADKEAFLSALYEVSIFADLEALVSRYFV